MKDIRFAYSRIDTLSLDYFLKQIEEGNIIIDKDDKYEINLEMGYYFVKNFPLEIKLIRLNKNKLYLLKGFNIIQNLHKIILEKKLFNKENNQYIILSDKELDYILNKKRLNVTFIEYQNENLNESQQIQEIKDIFNKFN